MVINRLPAVMAQKKISIRELSRQTGITYTTIRAVYHGERRSVQYDVLDAICRVLQIQPGDIFKYASEDTKVERYLHEETTIALARFPLRLLGATMIVETLGGVLMNALLGAGASRTVMVVSIALQWGLFLPVAFLLGPVLGFGMSAVWAAQVGYRCLQGLIFASIWRSRSWLSVEV